MTLAGSVFTYGERQKANHDKQTQRFVNILDFYFRLGGESMKTFESCCLCLQFARSPVCTPCGYIFCRECIVLNLAAQRAEFKKRLNLYEKQQDRLKAMLAEQAELDEKNHIENYKSKIDSVLTINKPIEKEISPSIDINITDEKPKCVLLNPMTLKSLQLSSLINLHPEVEDDKWVCPITQKIIVHQPAVAVIKSGEVFLKSAADKFILGMGCNKSTSWTKSKVVKPQDFVLLQMGGSGFSAHNNLEASPVGLRLK